MILMGSDGTHDLLLPCPNYFFKIPGQDQEGSGYGDETVRFFTFQVCMFKVKKQRKQCTVCVFASFINLSNLG